MGDISNDGASSISFLNKGNACLEFGKHGARRKLVGFHMGFGFFHGKGIQVFFLIGTKI